MHWSGKTRRWSEICSKPEKCLSLLNFLFNRYFIVENETFFFK